MPGAYPVIAALVVTGIIGAVIGSRLFDLIGIRDHSVKGIAIDMTSHGIGAARAFQVSAQMGAFSGLAMALSAFLYSIFLPWLLRLTGVLG